MNYMDYEFIRAYNNPNLTVEEIMQKLNLCHKNYYLLRKKNLGKLNKRKKGRPKNKPRTVKNFHYNHITQVFEIRKKGKYYGCLKTSKEAEAFVELMRENNWDINLKDELKQKAKEMVKE